MENKWSEALLVDCLESLIDYRGKTPKKSDKGILTLSAKSVKMGVINYDQAYHISKQTYDKFMVRGFPQKGDILLTTEAPLGCVAKLDRNGIAVAQRLITLRGKSEVLDNDYLKYYLMSPKGQHELLSRASGTTVQGIKRTEFAKIPIVLPPLIEQKAIAYILSSLDDKIELNRRMNETLEAMAKAMFKSWFVNFDPVIDNALAARNEIPDELKEKADVLKDLDDARKSLPKEIQALFPSEFEYSEELGWIPKGWKSRSVEDIMEVNPTVKLPKNTVAPFVDMKALPTTGYSVGGIIKKPYAGGAKFQNGDILLARITPCLENGKTAIVNFLDGDQIGFGSTEFIVLRGKGFIKTPFVACLSRNGKFRDHCIQSMVGSSGRQRVQNACFSNFYLSLPEDQDLLDEFHLLTECHFDQITKHSDQDRILTKLRDTLLPKLLSGEIRIPEAEKLVEGLK